MPDLRLPPAAPAAAALALVAALAAALVLAGCGREEPPDSQAAQPVPPATTAATTTAGAAPASAAASPALGSRARPAEIGAAFRRDIVTCPAALHVLARDKAFIDAFGYANNRESKPWSYFVAKSTARNNKDVKYLLANSRYFELGISMQGNPMALAWIKAPGIYCAPTLRRMRDIESAGESEPAWLVRSYFLDQMRRGLKNPADPTPASAVDSDYFRQFAQEAASFYSGQRRQDFRDWTNKAIAATNAERRKIDSSAGDIAADEQHRVLDERVKFLKGLGG
jgi:hypothetical protein